MGLLALAACASARADGLPFKGRRYAGAATVLVLTPGQHVQALACGRVSLYPHQRWRLRRAAGAAPRVLEVWSVEEAKGSCGCDFGDAAIRFAPGLVEVPHARLSRSGGEAPAWDARLAASVDALTLLVLAVGAAALYRGLAGRARPSRRAS